jgi:hypothetical protein
VNSKLSAIATARRRKSITDFIYKKYRFILTLASVSLCSQGEFLKMNTQKTVVMDPNSPGSRCICFDPHIRIYSRWANPTRERYF